MAVPGHDIRLTPLAADEFRRAIQAPFHEVFGRDPPNRMDVFSVRLLIHLGPTLAGWHFGGSNGGDTYMMTNTAVLPTFRRKGLYSRFVQLLIEDLRARGYRRVISRHRSENAAVIDAKKKQAFVEIGTDSDPDLGPLVILGRELAGYGLPIRPI